MVWAGLTVEYRLLRCWTGEAMRACCRPGEAAEPREPLLGARCCDHDTVRVAPVPVETPGSDLAPPPFLSALADPVVPAAPRWCPAARAPRTSTGPPETQTFVPLLI